jgi:sec-independent protein translocase protein TatB
MVIAIVALVVIGPKELPGVLRAAGKSVTKLRRMAGDFRAQFDEALKEADLQDLKESANSLRETVSGLKSGLSPLGAIKNEILSVGDAVKAPVTSAPSASAVGSSAVASAAASLPAMAAPSLLSPSPGDEPLAVVKEAKQSTKGKAVTGKKASPGKTVPTPAKAKRAEPAAPEAKAQKKKPPQKAAAVAKTAASPSLTKGPKAKSAKAAPSSRAKAGASA